VEDGALIGMAATVLNGAVIGAGSLVAAGAVVLEGTIVPQGSLVAGVPGRVRRELTAEEIAGIRHNAEAYLGHAALHRLAT
jgi:carbonic anhydrase/acetyltransferase-like protein (isoleucine patch superfamily)